MLKLRKALRLESLQLPFARALPIAAQLGVEGIEINARTEVRPSELSRTGIRHIRKLLADYRLSVSCIHFPTRHGIASQPGLERRLDATRAAMTMAWQLGCQVVSSRIGELPDPQSPERTILVQALEDLGRHGQRAGAVFAALTADHCADDWSLLLSDLSQGALSVDFDPGELLLADCDVQQAMRQLGGHVVHFRARDAVRDRSRGERLRVQLGRGSIDFASLLAILEEHSYSGFLAVQRPPGEGNLVELQQELEYLDTVFA